MSGVVVSSRGKNSRAFPESSPRKCTTTPRADCVKTDANGVQISPVLRQRVNCTPRLTLNTHANPFRHVASGPIQTVRKKSGEFSPDVCRSMNSARPAVSASTETLPTTARRVLGSRLLGLIDHRTVLSGRKVSDEDILALADKGSDEDNAIKRSPCVHPRRKTTGTRRRKSTGDLHCSRTPIRRVRSRPVSVSALCSPMSQLDDIEDNELRDGDTSSVQEAESVSIETRIPEELAYSGPHMASETVTSLEAETSANQLATANVSIEPEACMPPLVDETASVAIESCCAPIETTVRSQEVDDSNTLWEAGCALMETAAGSHPSTQEAVSAPKTVASVPFSVQEAATAPETVDFVPLSVQEAVSAPETVASAPLSVQEVACAPIEAAATPAMSEVDGVSPIVAADELFDIISPDPCDPRAYSACSSGEPTCDTEENGCRSLKSVVASKPSPAKNDAWLYKSEVPAECEVERSDDECEPGPYFPPHSGAKRPSPYCDPPPVVIYQPPTITPPIAPAFAQGPPIYASTSLGTPMLNASMGTMPEASMGAPMFGSTVLGAPMFNASTLGAPMFNAAMGAPIFSVPPMQPPMHASAGAMFNATMGAPMLDASPMGAMFNPASAPTPAQPGNLPMFGMDMRLAGVMLPNATHQPPARVINSSGSCVDVSSWKFVSPGDRPPPAVEPKKASFAHKMPKEPVTEGRSRKLHRLVKELLAQKRGNKDDKEIEALQRENRGLQVALLSCQAQLQQAYQMIYALRG